MTRAAQADSVSALGDLRREVERGWDLYGPDDPTWWSELVAQGTLIQTIATLPSLFAGLLGAATLLYGSKLDWLLEWLPVPWWSIVAFAAPMWAYIFVNDRAESALRAEAIADEQGLPFKASRLDVAVLPVVHRAVRWCVIAFSGLIVLGGFGALIIAAVAAYQGASLKQLAAVIIVLLVLVLYRLGQKNRSRHVSTQDRK